MRFMDGVEGLLKRAPGGMESFGGAAGFLSGIEDFLIASTRLRRGGSSSRALRRLGTYDTETDGFHNCEDLGCSKCHGIGRVPKPFLHGIYLEEPEEYVEFETVEDVVEYVQSRRILLYAHNGGKFDFHPLRQHMNTDEPIRLINGRISEFRIGEATFRDSLNIFPNTRLSDFGVKSDIDYEKMEPGTRDIPAVRKEISLYMRQDCKGLYDQVSRFRREYGTNLTQAGTMMKLWEKYYGQKAPRQSKKQFERCRPFYYGGRVQCFESGVAATQFRVADINSAYPRAMLEKHPISPGGSESRRLPRDTETLQASLIQLRCSARGCFPWRDETGDLFFPEDERCHRVPRLRRYFVTGWEFLAATELDAIKHIHIERVITFAQLHSFDGYILPAYEERLRAKDSGDVAGAIFGKYKMNGVYGKFGADPSNYAEYVIATIDTLELWKSRGYEEYQDWGEDKWLMARPPTEEELNDIKSRWRYYNVATAASITGYVRAFLFKAIAQASGVIYCDTDSVAARGLGSLDYGKGLGQWKDEGAFDRYSIAGKKLYAFHVEGAKEAYDPAEKNPSWKVASKGVNFASMKNGPDIIRDLALGKEFTHVPQVPTYSITRSEPVFVRRSISSTAKDIRIVS